MVHSIDMLGAEESEDEIDMPVDLFLSLMQAGEKRRKSSQHSVVADEHGRNQLIHTDLVDTNYQARSDGEATPRSEQHPSPRCASWPDVEITVHAFPPKDSCSDDQAVSHNNCGILYRALLRITRSARLFRKCAHRRQFKQFTFDKTAETDLRMPAFKLSLQAQCKQLAMKLMKKQDAVDETKLLEP